MEEIDCFDCLDAALMESEDLVSDEALRIFTWITYMISACICVFGTVTNIINIICFIKQGLKDPINVSFLGLAVSDLGSVVMLLWSNISFLPAFQESDVPFDPIELQYLITGWPHVVFNRVTSWITALITLERCLCITVPLKVKNLITPKRVTVIIVSIYVLFICSVSPVYYCNRYGMKFFPDRNKTVLGLVYTEDRAEVEKITFAIYNAFLPFGAYAMVISCTVILVVKLRKKTEWRRRCTAPANAETMSVRDHRMAKMVVMISTLFIACFVPLCCSFIAMAVEPKIALDGQYENTLFVFGGLSLLLEAANSATNIFIYYHMSSKYRTVFLQLFRKGR